MTRDDIIRMAREAGFVIDEVSREFQPNCIEATHIMVDQELMRFAALVATAEREACAQADKQGSCIACGNRITHPVPQQVEATAQKGGDK